MSSEPFDSGQAETTTSTTVLHVDDDQAFAEMTATLLERHHEGLTVRSETDPTAVATGEEPRAVDCIVSDYEMPGMDGLELFDALRGRGIDCPFILYTGKGSEEIASEAISRGVTDYIQKSSGADHYALLGNRIFNAVSEYRKRKALRESEQRYRSLVEKSPSAVCVIQDDQIVYTNREFVEILNAESEAEVLGLSPTEVVHPEERDELGARIERLERGGSNEHHEGRLLALDGEVKHVEVADSPVTYGSEPAAQIVLSDITDRKERERTLRERTERLQLLFEEAPEPVYVYDDEGNFQEVNRAAVESLGYTESELLSMSVDDVVVEPPPEEARECWTNTETGSYTRVEGVHERADGSTIPVDVWVRPIEVGEDRRYIAIACLGSN